MNANFIKFNCFIKDAFEGKHNLVSDTIRIALSNAANPPSISADVKLADITTISTENLDTTEVVVSSSEQTDGVYSLITADLTVTALGDVGPFRYILVYNDTEANDALMGYFDYESETSMKIDDVMLLDFTELFTAS